MNIINGNDEKDYFDVKMIGIPRFLNKTGQQKLLILGNEGIIIFESKTCNRLI